MNKDRHCNAKRDQHCKTKKTEMEGSPDVRVQIKYPYSGFSPNPENKSFDFFSRIVTNQFEICYEKNIFCYTLAGLIRAK